MTDKEIIIAEEALRQLDSLSSTASGFVPQHSVLMAGMWVARCMDACRAIKPMGDPKASALLDELVKLTLRIIQSEAPAEELYSRDRLCIWHPKRHVII